MTFKGNNGQDNILSKLNRLISACKQKYYNFFLNTGVNSKWTKGEKAIMYFLRQEGFLFINIAK